jgi:hypothetical protein
MESVIVTVILKDALKSGTLAANNSKLRNGDLLTGFSEYWNRAFTHALPKTN